MQARTWIDLERLKTAAPLEFEAIVGAAFCAAGDLSLILQTLRNAEERGLLDGPE